MTDLPSFLLTFRETLEAALVVGIVLAFLAKTKQQKYNKTVYLGLLGGVIASVTVAVLFTLLVGEFEGTAEQVFEGTTMLAGVALMTTMILWMINQRNIAKDIEKGVQAKINEAQKLGLLLLVFFSVLREGTEIVIFLGAASFTGAYSLPGAVLGIIVSVAFSYLLFTQLVKVNLKKVFSITSLLLILFGAGLVGQGVHEFQEAGVLPVLTETAWDISPGDYGEGPYPLLHEDGDIGGVLHGLFGYDSNPTRLQILAYLLYIIPVSFVYFNNGKKRSAKNR